MLAESAVWLGQLNEMVPFVRLEKGAHEIKKTCERARSLLKSVTVDDASIDAVESLRELYELDQTASGCRQRPQWHFKTVAASDLSLDPPFQPITRRVELHGDVWRAYELNYHRTARILLHQQLLKVLEAILAKLSLSEPMILSLHGMMGRSATTVGALVESILATVPQSLGDIDHSGYVPHAQNGIPKCRSIGCYLLLWPIKIFKAPSSAASLEQRGKARSVYERIRDYTGMKSRLGDLSMLP